MTEQEYRSAMSDVGVHIKTDDMGRIIEAFPYRESDGAILKFWNVPVYVGGV